MKKDYEKGKPEKRKTWLWVLGWIFLFPVPVMKLLKRSSIKTPVKVILIVLSWFVWLGLDITFNTRNSAPPVREGSLSNTELLAEAYPKLQNIEECDSSGTVPARIENYLILCLDGASEKIIAKNINGNHDLYAPLTESDIHSLDMIVVAVKDSFVKNYAHYVDGKKEGGAVPFRVGTAGIYYFDPKAGTVFMSETVKAHQLKNQEAGYQTDFKLSDNKIIESVDEHYHLKLGFPVRFGVWFTQDSGYGLLIVLVFGVGMFFLIRVLLSEERERRKRK